jgi:hypothetical protein
MQIRPSGRPVFGLTATAVLVNDVQGEFLFQGHTHRAQDDSHRSGDATLLADYFADVLRCDAQFEYRNAFASQRPNLNTFGLINQGLCELFDQLAYFCRLVWHRSNAPKMWSNSFRSKNGRASRELQNTACGAPGNVRKRNRPACVSPLAQKCKNTSIGTISL